MVGIGTDNSGSVRIPSAFNGLIGLRPTTGLISQNGILPRGNMDGTAGPIARTPEDLARVLGVVAHADPSDPKTLNISRTEDYTQFLVATGLNHKRIGIIQSVNGVNLFKGMPTDTLTTLQKGFKEMQKMGATLIPDIHLPHYDMNRRFNEAGEREDVNHYLASYPAARKNYAEICNSGRTSLFGTSAQCLTFIKNLPEKNSVQYQRALAIFKKNRTYVEGIMEKYHLDALLVPVSAYGSATYDDSTVLSEGVASNAGLPGITFTLGYTHSEAQMPIGIELIGKHLDEGPLIGMAYAWQKHVGPRQAPVMPAPDTQLSGLDIPALNNLFTLIGNDAYQAVLKNSTQENYVKNLSPEKFRDIVTKRLSEPLYIKNLKKDGLKKVSSINTNKSYS
jgi:aspartyl-tRNA(Asn)/glutamyl-tRNA(Gln) amidotransferase subunit A